MIRSNIRLIKTAYNLGIYAVDDKDLKYDYL